MVEDEGEVGCDCERRERDGGGEREWSNQADGLLTSLPWGCHFD
jgi:hypothetical protein